LAETMSYEIVKLETTILVHSLVNYGTVPKASF
jgi:hypothetical protein